MSDPSSVYGDDSVLVGMVESLGDETLSLDELKIRTLKTLSYLRT